MRRHTGAAEPERQSKSFPQKAHEAYRAAEATEAGESSAQAAHRQHEWRRTGQWLAICRKPAANTQSTAGRNA